MSAILPSAENIPDWITVHFTSDQIDQLVPITFSPKQCGVTVTGPITTRSDFESFWRVFAFNSFDLKKSIARTVKRVLHAQSSVGQIFVFNFINTDYVFKIVEIHPSEVTIVNKVIPYTVPNVVGIDIQSIISSCVSTMLPCKRSNC